MEKSIKRVKTFEPITQEQVTPLAETPGEELLPQENPTQDILPKQPVDDTVQDLVESIFRVAVERHYQRQKPSDKWFTNPDALKEFQQEGLGWFLTREGYRRNDRDDSGDYDNFKIINSVHGGILADEMGLGKTIQMIALICTHMAPKNRTADESQATLVVVPKSLLGTWKNELETWAPKLNVYIFHGANVKELSQKSFFQNHVVITTYETMTLHVERRLKSVRWWRIILDEGHRIRTVTSQMAQAAHSLKARNRWIMSGTPVQNRWRDLFSLLKFLRVRPYGEFQGWYRLIEQPLTGTAGYKKYKRQAADNLKNVVGVLVMRRTKLTLDETILNPILKKDIVIRLHRHPDRAYRENFWKVFKIKPDTFAAKNEEGMLFENIPYTDGEGQRMYEFVKELVHIPPKHIEDVRLDFTADEMVNYQNLKQKGKIGDTVINANPLVFLLRLRQMTIHPWMVLPQDKFQEKIKSVQSVQTVEEANKKFVWSAKLKYLLNDINTNLRRNPNEKSLVFSQFTRALNLVELALRIQGWISESDYQNELRKYNKTNKRRPFEYENRLRYVRIDGSSSNEEREDAMRQLRNEPNVKLALLSLRAAGEGLNLISANNVYFLDLYFNPQVHAQAIDRTHRIGQEKVVKVKMIVINNTIEDEIRKLLNFKENLAKFTLKPPTISQDIVLKLLK